jgi:hypothetical protein
MNNKSADDSKVVTYKKEKRAFQSLGGLKTSANDRQGIPQGYKQNTYTHIYIHLIYYMYKGNHKRETTSHNLVLILFF